MKVELKKITCKKCDHKWLPRQKEVRICPKCKTAYFDVARRKAKAVR